MDERRTDMTTQRLTLTLDGITAGDYLTWVRDPEPAALGHGLYEVSVTGDPLGDRVDAALAWDGPAPSPLTAAAKAGLPLTPEVAAVRSQSAPAAVPASRTSCSKRRARRSETVAIRSSSFSRAELVRRGP
jgi:hypothetical protein